MTDPAWHAEWLAPPPVEEQLSTEAATPWMRALFHESPLAIGFSRDGFVLDMNAAYVRVFGYTSADEIRGRSLLDQIAPHARQAILEKIRARQAGEAVAPVYETIGLRKDGTEFPFLIHVTRVLLPDGPLTIASITDITEHRRIEQSLQGVVDFNRRLIEASSVGILAYAADGPCIVANEAAAAFVGAPTSVLLAQNFRALDSWKTSGLLDLAEAALATGTVQSSEIALKSSFGRESRLHCRFTTFEVSGARHVLMVANDVSEQVRTLDALRTSEERLRLALDATGEGPWDWQAGLGVHLSARCRELLGIRDEDRLHAPPSLLAHLVDEDVSRARAMVEDRGARDHVAEFRVKGAEPIRWLLVRGRTVEWGESGRPVRMIGTIADISEQKRSEEQRRMLEERTRQAQKLESLGILARGIAHDFNNLLTSILGNVELASMDLPADSRGQVRLRAALSAARKAGDLCRQMLTYSGRADVQGEPIDLRTVVDDVSEILTTTLVKKAHLRLNTSHEAAFVHADVTQLRQVVLNLVINAAEALVGGEGTITISVGVASLDQETLARMPAAAALAEGPYAWLEVADTGVGMDAETCARIFDPFYSTKFAGRGLGMAVVHGVVRGHGGGILIDSAPGRGTTIRVFFPRIQAPTSDVEAAAPAATPGPRGAVLVVDDDDDVSLVATEMLSILGYRPIRARHGEEALRMILGAGAAPFEAVLLDLDMPVMDGPTALRALRRAGSTVPVIICSGDGKQRLGADLEHLGTDGCLRKPFDLGELSRVLREASQGRSPAGPGPFPAASR